MRAQTQKNVSLWNKQSSSMMSGDIMFPLAVCSGSKFPCHDDYLRVNASGATGPPVLIPSSSKSWWEPGMGTGGCHCLVFFTVLKLFELKTVVDLGFTKCS